MAVGAADVLFKAEFDATGAIKGLKAVQTEAGAAKPKTDSFVGSLKSMVPALAGAMVVSKFAGFLKDCVVAAGESERAQVKLNAVYKATGGVVGMSTKDLNALADEMQHTTGISGELVQGAEAILLTFRSIQGDAFPRTMQAASDLSAVFGNDLNGSVTMLGKALEDPERGMTALRRVGVSFTQDQQAVIKAMVDTNDLAGAQAEILRIVELQVGGTANALGGTLTGQIAILSEAWGDVKESIGGFLTKANESIPLLTTMATGASAVAEALKELSGQTEITDAKQELSAHALENMIKLRGDELKALNDHRAAMDYDSPAYTTASEKMFALAQEIVAYKDQLPETTTREHAAADAAKRIGDEGEKAAPKVANLGDLMKQYFGPDASYSAAVTGDTSAASTTLTEFIAWVNLTFPPDQAHDIIMAAATAAAKGDLETFAADIATLVPATLTTTAEFAAAGAVGDAGVYAGDLSAAVPSALTTTAAFGAGEALADAGIFGLDLVDAVPPELTTTAEFVAGTALGDGATFGLALSAAVPADLPTVATFDGSGALVDAGSFGLDLGAAVPAGTLTTAAFEGVDALGTAATYAAGITGAVPAGVTTIAGFDAGDALADAGVFGLAIGTAVPGALTTTAAFAPGTAEADALDLGDALVGILPPALTTVAEFSSGTSADDAELYGVALLAAVPAAVSTTAAFASGGAAGDAELYGDALLAAVPGSVSTTAAFADTVARSDAQGYASALGTAVPAGTLTTAAFADAAAKAAIGTFKGAVSGVPGTVTTTAAFGDSTAKAAIGGFKSILGTVPAGVTTAAEFNKRTAHTAVGELKARIGEIPSAATVTAKFADIAARGVIGTFLEKVAKDFPPGKAAEITAAFKDAQARGDVGGFLTYVDTQLPADKKQSVTAAFVDVQARLDANEYAGFLPLTVPAGYTSILKVDPAEGKTKANEYADWLKSELDSAGSVELKAQIDKEQTAFEFKTLFDETVKPILATALTDGIIGALSGEGFKDAWSGMFKNLAGIGAKQLDTMFSGLLSGKGIKQSLQDAGLMSSAGKFNWAAAATSAGAMIQQAGEQRQNRGMATFGGMISGAGMGASIGSIIPGVGTVVGAIVGAIVGGIMAYVASGKDERYYDVWAKQREDNKGMRFGVIAPGDTETQAEMSRQLGSTFNKTTEVFRQIFDAMGQPFTELGTISLEWEGKSAEFSTTWRTLLSSTLPRAIFNAYKPAMQTAMEAFGVEGGRARAELAKFSTLSFDEAAKSLANWINAIVSVRQALVLTGMGFEEFKTRALEGTLESWRRAEQTTQANLARWSSELSGMNTEEQVANAAKMVDAINAQIGANVKLLQSLEDLRTKYTAEAGPDLSIGDGGAGMLVRVGGAVADVVAAISGADTVEKLIAAAAGADDLRKELGALADEFTKQLEEFNAARADLATLLADMSNVQPLALEDALASVQQLMVGLDGLAPADAAARVTKITALLQEQYDLERSNLENIVSIQQSLAASWDALFGKWAEGKMTPEEVMAKQQAALAAIVEQIAATSSPAEVDKLARQAQQLAGTLWDNLTKQIDELAKSAGDPAALAALEAQRQAVEDMAHSIANTSAAQLDSYKAQAEAQLELIKAAAQGVSDVLAVRAGEYDAILAAVQAADQAIADSLGTIGDRLDVWEAEIKASNELLDTRANELLDALTSENGAREDLIQAIDMTTDAHGKYDDAIDDGTDGMNAFTGALALAAAALAALETSSDGAADAAGALALNAGRAATGTGALATNAGSAANAANDAAAAMRNVRDSDPTRAGARGENPAP